MGRKNWKVPGIAMVLAAVITAGLCGCAGGPPASSGQPAEKQLTPGDVIAWAEWLKPEADLAMSVVCALAEGPQFEKACSIYNAASAAADALILEARRLQALHDQQPDPVTQQQLTDAVKKLKEKILVLDKGYKKDVTGLADQQP